MWESRIFLRNGKFLKKGLCKSKQGNTHAHPDNDTHTHAHPDNDDVFLNNPKTAITGADKPYNLFLYCNGDRGVNPTPVHLRRQKPSCAI
jgi:hypothetical protein